MRKNRRQALHARILSGMLLAGLACVWGCGAARRPPAPEGARGATGPADASVSLDAGATAENPAEASDYPDEPEDGQGQLRDVGPRKAGGGRCLLRVAPVDPALHEVVRQWIHTREEVAARDAAALCGSERASGAVAAGFACRALARRPAALAVACYTFPNVMGNANPSRAHAVFDTAGGSAKRLGVTDMFVDPQAACTVVGAALAARGPQLHERSPAEWSERCRVSAGSPVADDAVSVLGPNLTFDVSHDFLAWGNAPDPLQVPVEALRSVLTPRFAALLRP